MNVHVNLTYKC